MHPIKKYHIFSIVLLFAALSWASPDHEQSSSPFEEVVMLTTPEQFVKAGESYISPDGKQIVFQAIPTPPQGEAPDQYYSMYVANLTENEEPPRWSLANIRRLSPEASSNTCAWFHPQSQNHVIFASTIEAPRDRPILVDQDDKRGILWQFPPEMRIVETRIDGALPAALRYLEGDEEAYQADCRISPDGRHLLYASMESGDGDVFVRDLETGIRRRILAAPGHDGSPFFSPDGSRICYRSIREQDDGHQLFVGELAFDDAGAITGLAKEFQVTHNKDVNGAPFWHSSGRYLIFAREAEQDNHEVFIVDLDPGDGDPESGKPERYGARTARLTDAIGFDGLPALDAESKIMVWTSQRHGGSSQLYITNFPEDPEMFFAVPRQVSPKADNDGS